MRPCTCDNCRLCWLYHHDPRYRQRWDASGRQPPVAPRACLHLGGPTGATRDCLICRGKIQVPLLGCRVHGPCTKDMLLAGIACCRICPDASFKVEHGHTDERQT